MSTIDERREHASAGVAVRDDDGVWENEFARPRVFLQPIAAPSVLGLAGFSVATMREASRRGSHVTLRHPDAYRITRAAIERAKVVPDFRAPDRLRLGPAPLTTRFVDVWDALDRIRRLVGAGEHEQYPADRARVT